MQESGQKMDGERFTKGKSFWEVRFIFPHFNQNWNEMNLFFYNSSYRFPFLFEFVWVILFLVKQGSQSFNFYFGMTDAVIKEKNQEEKDVLANNLQGFSHWESYRDITQGISR